MGTCIITCCLIKYALFTTSVNIPRFINSHFCKIQDLVHQGEHSIAQRSPQSITGGRASDEGYDTNITFWNFVEAAHSMDSSHYLVKFHVHSRCQKDRVVLHIRQTELEIITILLDCFGENVGVVFLPYLDHPNEDFLQKRMQKPEQ